MKRLFFFLIFLLIIFSCKNKRNIVQDDSENNNKLTTIEESPQHGLEEAMYVNSLEGLRVRKAPDIDSKEEVITKNTVISNLNPKIIVPFSIEELNALPSLWQIETEDSKYLIEDRGTTPPPRFVVVKNLENKEIIFFATYFQNINLREYTIEIVKNYGTYYAGEWSINKNLANNEIDFGKTFLNENEPPLEWVEIADLAKGNSLGLLIIFEYNFKTKESKIVGGKYYKTI